MFCLSFFTEAQMHVPSYSPSDEKRYTRFSRVLTHIMLPIDFFAGACHFISDEDISCYLWDIQPKVVGK